MLGKRFLSLLTALTLCSNLPVVYGSTLGEIYKDEVDVGIGETVHVSMTYGDNTSSAEIILSNMNIEATLSGNTLNIKGLYEGISYVTLLFDDGSRDFIRVTVDDNNSYDINENHIEIEKYKTKSIYLDLDKYGAKNARVTYDKSELTVNKTYFSSDGFLRITGENVGESVLKIEYSTGDIERYYINVVNNNIVNDSIQVYLNDYENYYIDLRDYDAESATVYYDSDYVSVNNTYFTTSGNLRISGKDIGVSSIRVRFDTGEDLYISVNVDTTFEESCDYEEIYNLDEKETADYYIDLDYYNSDFAIISYNSKYVSVNKDRFTSSGYLEITGEYRGTVDLKITYESGKIEYLQVVVENGSYVNEPYLSVDEINVIEDEKSYITVNLGDTGYVNIRSSNSSIASVSSSYLSSDDRIYVTGKREGKTDITFTFQGGKKITVPITVIDKDSLNSVVTLKDNKIKIGESTTITVEMGSLSDSFQMYIENPLKFDVDIDNYDISENMYTIKSNKNSKFDIEITGVSPCDSTDIIFYFADGQTCKVTLEVLDNEREETYGFASNGTHFVLRPNISVNTGVLSKGYINGYTDGSFGPDKSITREEFGVMLSRILDYNGVIRDSDYIFDVTANWAKAGIAKLVAMDIVENNGNYRPTAYITRYEVAEMLYNVLDLTDFSTESSLLDLQGNDSRTVKMSQCNNAGIITGYPNKTFGGNNSITRAEAVVMLNRVFYENNETWKTTNFIDLTESHWAYAYILKVANR